MYRHAGFFPMILSSGTTYQCCFGGFGHACRGHKRLSAHAAAPTKTEASAREKMTRRTAIRR